LITLSGKNPSLARRSEAGSKTVRYPVGGRARITRTGRCDRTWGHV